MSQESKKLGLESQVKRNPHGDFNKVEQSREPFETDVKWHYTQIPKVDWTPGQGANDDSWKKHRKLSIDPFAADRNPVDNYKLLISGVVPRPIGFVSSISGDGVKNLAPFSYFSVANHDPPIFTIGFSGGKGNPKDTARNILETGELTINIISEWFVEAANFCSTNSPSAVDEWKLSGLTPLKSNVVKPDHVAESAFSIEAKLVHSHEWKSKRDPERATGILCIVEGVQFHVREDVVSEELNNIDISKLKPVSRLGGITYGRTTQGFERLRPDYEKDVANKEEVTKLLG
jgi:flavin reductase (DIM6/NTAB) family NADH-FMN oxidoreductase RutF